MMSFKPMVAVAILFWLGMVSFVAAADDPLPSWNATESKSRLVAYVHSVTDKDSPGFVPPQERIAVFDNDGTLWSEKPMYFQAFFLIDRVKALAPLHPEWKTQEPFASLLKGDMKAVAESGEHGLVALMAATHAGMTTDEFTETVAAWIATARHPVTGRLFTEMTYQPMQELLEYLRSQGFKTFIVSGGGVEFIRPWAERAYGIPPEQVVGSSLKTKFEMRDGVPTVMKLPEVNLIDDGAGKPVGIQQQIGRTPIAAFGNSDGDLQMLQWTTIPRRTDDKTPRLGLIVHHTDAEREFAYNRQSHVGKLDKALDEASQRGWIVVDMLRDWKTIYPDVVR